MEDRWTIDGLRVGGEKRVGGMENGSEVDREDVCTEGGRVQKGRVGGWTVDSWTEHHPSFATFLCVCEIVCLMSRCSSSLKVPRGQVHV